MKNKRKLQRVSCWVPVDGKQGGFFQQTRTVDISKSGIGFVSHKKIPLNQRIAIELDLSQEDEPVFVIGKVRWVYPIARTGHYRIGLSFTDFKQGSKSRLEDYFNQ